VAELTEGHHQLAALDVGAECEELELIVN